MLRLGLVVVAIEEAKLCHQHLDESQTYLILFTAITLQVTPGNFVHSVLSTRQYSRIYPYLQLRLITHQYRPSSLRSHNTVFPAVQYLISSDDS